MITGFEVVTRLILSAIVSGFIGYEREVHSRPAGLRTHILVTLGSTLIMLISLEGFTSGDPSRLAAQVVSGIGFLGAGTIMRTGNNISGLTTAASLWVCAGIGLAIGAGYYIGVIVTTFIVLFTLSSSGWIEKRNLKNRYHMMEVVATREAGLIGQIESVLDSYNIRIKDMSLESDLSQSSKSQPLIRVKFFLKYPEDCKKQDFFEEIYEIKGIKNIL